MLILQAANWKAVDSHNQQPTPWHALTLATAHQNPDGIHRFPCFSYLAEAFQLLCCYLLVNLNHHSFLDSKKSLSRSARKWKLKVGSFSQWIWIAAITALCMFHQTSASWKIQRGLERYPGHQVRKPHPGTQTGERWRLRSVYWQKGSCRPCSLLWERLLAEPVRWFFLGDSL